MYEKVLTNHFHKVSNSYDLGTSQLAICKAILNVLAETKSSMRVSEIQKALYPNWKLSCQKISAMLKKLYTLTLVKREDVETGKVTHVKTWGHKTIFNDGVPYKSTYPIDLEFDKKEVISVYSINPHYSIDF